MNRLKKDLPPQKTWSPLQSEYYTTK